MRDGGGADGEESYHLLVTPHLERMLTQLSGSAHAAQDAPLFPSLCASCRDNLVALGFTTSGIHCQHVR